MAVDDREQLWASLGRLQEDLEEGRRDLAANAELLTETEALLDAKRRLLRRLLAEMEAVDLDTERLLAERDARQQVDAVVRDVVVGEDNDGVKGSPPPGTMLPPTPCGTPYARLGLTHKGHDNDSNSDTGLSSLLSSSEEGVYILDTLV